MERALCEQCGCRQPGDWTAGQLCVACGAAVRREVRCAWCAGWTPAVRFCRACGCEVLGPEQYGAARMLKSAGVDRFELAQRLAALDPEQIANLGRIYNAQLAVVTRRVEEVRLCESGLLQKEFSKRLEEELVPRLPLDKEDLGALAAGPSGPFDRRPELLPEIAECSPIETTRMLAAITLLRQGCFQKTFAGAQQALASEDAELALEAALAFTHWRVRLYPRCLWRQVSAYADFSHGIDPRRLAEVAGAVPSGSGLRPWAAAAVALARYGEYRSLPQPESGDSPENEGRDWLRPALHDGLGSRDPDLRFACAMALPQMESVAAALGSEDAQRKLVARTFLARHQSPAVAPLLIDGSDQVRQAILEDLWEPLPEALIEPVLRAVEHGSPEVRRAGVRLLLPSLSEAIVERLLRLAKREGDTDILAALGGCERLPASQAVVRAILEAGVGSLRDEHIDFADAAVLEQEDPAVMETLVAIAGRRIDACSAPDGGGFGAALPAARFLARIACGAAPATLRDAAYRKLDFNRCCDWMSVAGIRQLFGDGAGFLQAISAVLRDPELDQCGMLLLDKLQDHWGQAAPLLAGERKALQDLIATASKLTRDREHSILHEHALRLLVKAATLLPAAGIPTLAALLRDCGAQWQFRDLPAQLLAEYGALSVGTDAALAGKMADGLLAVLSGRTSLDYGQVALVELLTRLAQDHAGDRERIGKCMAPFLEDREFADPSLREPLEALAVALGWKKESEAPPEESPAPPPPPAKSFLDDLVVLPGTPLATLSQYVEFLKAMGTGADPMEVMARFGLTLESYTECVSRWGEVLGSSGEFAMRYARLLEPQAGG